MHVLCALKMRRMKLEKSENSADFEWLRRPRQRLPSTFITCPFSSEKQLTKGIC